MKKTWKPSGVRKYLVGSLFCFVSSAIASSEASIDAVLAELNSRPEPVNYQKVRRLTGGRGPIYSIDQYPGYILKIDRGNLGRVTSAWSFFEAFGLKHLFVPQMLPVIVGGEEMLLTERVNIPTDSFAHYMEFSLNRKGYGDAIKDLTALACMREIPDFTINGMLTGERIRYDNIPPFQTVDNNGNTQYKVALIDLDHYYDTLPVRRRPALEIVREVVEAFPWALDDILETASYHRSCFLTGDNIRWLRDFADEQSIRRYTMYEGYHDYLLAKGINPMSASVHLDTLYQAPGEFKLTLRHDYDTAVLNLAEVIYNTAKEKMQVKKKQNVKGYNARISYVDSHALEYLTNIKQQYIDAYMDLEKGVEEGNALFLEAVALLEENKLIYRASVDRNRLNVLIYF
ncbi:hypothetical protein [Endozoicomonas sp. 8E]|uniref:hypothetical protein n=1 Tax=Endozoicomonas sp. 8E TaxID=3035692 RepID=UPI0029390924|nr:hypothetical protein [Endozoicomonas sp. 8E]WOG28262.1 hypothetical protein P6910_01025 [Endozoicomonas sp. 8E]